MTRQLLPLLLAMAALTLGIPAVAPAQPVDPQAIVAQHYPFRRLSPEDVPRRSCYQVAATSPSGDPLRIGVGYTDTVDGVLQILDRDPQANYRVFYESSSNLGMDGGITCDVSLVDVDGTIDAMLEMNFAKGCRGEGRHSPAALVARASRTPLVLAAACVGRPVVWTCGFQDVGSRKLASPTGTAESYWEVRLVGDTRRAA